MEEKKLGFYESKGCVRHMVILPVEYKERLKAVAKKYGITQGEVIEEMLDCMDGSSIPQKLEARRHQKTSGKTTKTELVKRMKGLTPEQIAAIEKIIGEQQ